MSSGCEAPPLPCPMGRDRKTPSFSASSRRWLRAARTLVLLRMGTDGSAEAFWMSRWMRTPGSLLFTFQFRWMNAVR